WFGGHREQAEAGIPEMIGGVLSILIVTGTELDNPTPFVAEHVSVTPAVSAVSVEGLQPDEDAIPDSGAATVQLTFTMLVYHPLLRKVPEIIRTITGGLVSVAWSTTDSAARRRLATGASLSSMIFRIVETAARTPAARAIAWLNPSPR